MPRFHLPLLEPDVQVSRIRLTFEHSGLRMRRGHSTSRNWEKPQFLVQVGVRKLLVTDHLGVPLPPGTRKWNKIEHRLFSQIVINWRGEPLTSHEVIVELIGRTTNVSGLKVRARLDKRRCPAGPSVAKEVWATLALFPTHSTVTGTIPSNHAKWSDD